MGRVKIQTKQSHKMLRYSCPDDTCVQQLQTLNRRESKALCSVLLGMLSQEMAKLGRLDLSARSPEQAAPQYTGTAPLLHSLSHQDRHMRFAVPTHPLQVPGAPQRPNSPFVPEVQTISPLLAAKSILMSPCLNKRKLRFLHCRRKAPWTREEDIPIPVLHRDMGMSLFLQMNPFITSSSRPFTTAYNRENYWFGCQPEIFLSPKCYTFHLPDHPCCSRTNAAAGLLCLHA